MVAPKTTQAQKPADPDLDDFANAVKKETMLELNSMHVGTIQSFDKLKQTATVTINYLRTYFEKDSTGVYAPVTKPYPLLIDVPVFFLGGAAGALEFPVAKGDECAVLFNDRCLDGWFTGSSNSALSSSRLHSLADGMALVGIRSLAKVITAFDGTRVVLRNGLNARAAVATDNVSLEYGTAGAPGLPTVKVDANGVLATRGTGAALSAVTLDASGITATRGTAASTATVVMDATGITATRGTGAGIPTVTIDANGITITKGAGAAAVTLVIGTTIKGTIGSTVTFEITSAGKISFTNATGELLSVLNDLFTDIQNATAGGYPLIMPTFAADLTKFLSFKV